MATKKRTAKAKSAQPNPIGRPKLTLDDLPDGWQTAMLELAKDGASDVSLRVNALDGICSDTWYRFIKDYPDFSATVKRCHELCEDWWETTGRGMATGKDGNATVWIFNMKNRFGWRDKQEVEHTGANGGPIELTDRTERVSRLAFLLGRGRAKGTGSDSTG